MFLIDSLYINNSGGLRLLEYLIVELKRRAVTFYLLADSRCAGKLDECEHVEYMNASMRKRKRFYLQHINDFTSVLCFGNIPAPVKMEVPVYTYFHNINLLTLAEAHNISVKMKSWLKREVFKFYKKNTDYWLVQTSNTANELIKHLNETHDRVMIMPFYELSDKLRELSSVEHGDDYVYVSNYTGAKGHEELLEAWRLLLKRGLDKTLHLTVPNEAHTFADSIAQAQKEGVNVINHGFVPFEEVLELYKKSKAIVYPSHNESLGLGIVEAITAGCDVIGSNLPFIHSICKPSVTFNPYFAESIADAIMEYEKHTTQKSSIHINNMINEVIDLLTENNVKKS